MHRQTLQVSKVAKIRNRGFMPTLTFVEIDHEIISVAILFSSAESFKKGYQLQVKECAPSAG